MIVNKLSLIVVSYHVADKSQVSQTHESSFYSILSSGSGFGFPAVHMYIKPLCA